MLVLHILPKKNTHISACITLYISKSATVTVHICTVGYCNFLYIILIIFLSPHILSLSLTLSLQPIISTIDQHNLALPTTTTTTTLQYITIQPQNQPKIKHTHTQTHEQRQIEHCCELVAVGWCLEVSWNESWCLWRRSEWVDWDESLCLWIDASGKEGCLWWLKQRERHLIVRERVRGGGRGRGEFSSMEAAMSSRMERESSQIR